MHAIVTVIVASLFRLNNAYLSFAYSGHNIVPVTIPTGTLLYHGTYENVIPTTPEFVAVDPEHSYPFCRWLEEGKGCYHLTLAATRPLNILYFDGGSAAMMHGCMDAQDLIVWGEVKPERIFNDYGRIKFLCEWGKKYKLDGFVRMQANLYVNRISAYQKFGD